MSYRFPFGEKVKRLEQQDRSPKKAFVLGVYASAVHAKWVNSGGTVCQALAVASEPSIFWNGDINEARKIIERIKIPPGVGKLVLPNRNLIGPSGKVLDENILKPLGVKRENTWLCDLLPESRLNPNQQRVVTEKYNPLIKKFGLNEVTVPPEDGVFCDDVRRKEIKAEILTSKADILVLLGDKPIEQFLKHECDINFTNLRGYTNKYGYGGLSEVKIEGTSIMILPVAHPRQIGALGNSNQFWYDEHERWKNKFC